MPLGVLPSHVTLVVKVQRLRVFVVRADLGQHGVCLITFLSFHTVEKVILSFGRGRINMVRVGKLALGTRPWPLDLLLAMLSSSSSGPTAKAPP
jgi:hypothetical protein